MEAQCGAGGQPRDQTSSVHIQGYGDGPTRNDCLSQLISVYYYPKQSIIGQLQRLRPIMIVLHTIWRPNVVLEPAQIRPPQDTYEVMVMALRETMV